MKTAYHILFEDFKGLKPGGAATSCEASAKCHFCQSTSELLELLGIGVIWGVSMKGLPMKMC